MSAKTLPKQVLAEGEHGSAVENTLRANIEMTNNNDKAKRKHHLKEYMKWRNGFGDFGLDFRPRQPTPNPNPKPKPTLKPKTQKPLVRYPLPADHPKFQEEQEHLKNFRTAKEPNKSLLFKQYLKWRKKLDEQDITSVHVRGHATTTRFKRRSVPPSASTNSPEPKRRRYYSTDRHQVWYN